MFDIYLKNFNQNGNIITQETLIQSVPALNEGGIKLLTPIVKNEMGNAESLDFSIESGVQYYDAFLQMKTKIRIVYDGDPIFYGRVLTIDNNSFRRTKKIRCEGPFTFLLDSPVEGIPETKRSKVTINSYIQTLLTNHNNYVNDPDKAFYIGEIPGNYSAAVSEEQKIKNDERSYGSDSWTDTKSALEDLRSHYGGYFRVRHVNGSNYLDWMNHYFNSTVNDQTVEVGKNILDINDVTEIDNVFTAIVPIGKANNSQANADNGIYINGYTAKDKNGNDFTFDSKLFLVPDVCRFYSDSDLSIGYHRVEYYANAIDKYGIIVKNVSFSDATTKEKLFESAKEWIKNNFQGEVIKFTIKAIDMHQIGRNVSKIMVGDQVNIVYMVGDEAGNYERRTIKLTCLDVQYDLYHPENNSYTFGIPANILTKTYGVKKQSKTVTGGSAPKSTEDGTALDEEKAWIDSVALWLKNHRLHYNGTKPWAPGKSDKNSALETGGVLYKPRLLFPTTLVKARHNIYRRETSGKLIPFLDKITIANSSDIVLDGPEWVGQIVQLSSKQYFNADLLEAFHVCEYVLYEYGYDLRSQLSVKAPELQISEETGAITGYQEVEDPETQQKAMLKAWYFDPENNELNICERDGQAVKAYLDEDGNYHYYYYRSDTGEVVETNIRDLHIQAINTEKKVGWIVEENGQGDLQFANPGEMTLAIEGHAQGELVVSRVAGELMYLGNTKTQRIMTTSVEHMDQVTGDVEYVPDETDPSLKVFKINSGGGMRVNHGKKVLKTGPDGKPLDPNDPANWEYETITDPDTGEKKIVTADFGVYDSNNLVGGILSEKLNDGTVKTLIRGDVVDIKASQMASIGIYTDDHYDAGFIVNRINNGNQKINGTNINITSDQVLISDAVGSDTLKSWMDDTDDDISEVTGSAIWRNRDQVTNVAGKFKFEQNPDGTTRMVIVSGGGLNIEKNNVQYGIYDSQTLNGGVVVDKLNDGTVTTTINGNALVFGDANTVTAEVTATELAKFGLVDANGQFTGGLVASKLNDGTVTTTINGNALVFGDANTVSAEVTATELAKFGLVDANGQFTGGLVANKLNDGTVTTTINGNALVFGDANTVSAEVTATELAKFGLVDANGHFTGGLVANKLNDGTVTTTINGNALVFGDANTVSAEVTATELAKFGLVDANGQFNGGLIANKLNDGTVTTNISGSIVNLQANTSFSAIVGGSGANAKIKPAAIQAAIDSATGASKITLSAAHIELDGEAVAASLTGQEIDALKLTAINAILDNIQTGYSYAQYYRVGGSGTGEGYDISNPLSSATVSQDGKTLKLYYADGTEAVTFNKAASIDNLTGSWSGTSADSLLTIGTNPDTGKTWRVGFGRLTYNTNLNVYLNGEPTLNGTSLSTPVRIATMENGTPPVITTRFETTLPVNATAAIEAGAASVPRKVSGKWTDNTYTVKYDANGFSSVSETIGVRFNVSSGSYYAAATRTDSSGNVIDITSKTYKLGLSGTTVQIQNGSGTQYSGTPTYTIPLETKTATSNGDVTPSTGVGLSKVTVNVPLFVKGSWGTGTSSNTYTVKYDASGSSPSASVTVTADISYDSTTHKYTAKANAGGSTRATKPSGTEAYSAGWTAAYGKVILPANNTSSSQMVVQTPNSTVDGTGTNTYYTVSVDNNYAYIKNGNNVKAQVSHSVYTNGYNAGWNAVGISDGWSSNTYTVSASAKTDGTKREKSITVTAGISYDPTTHKYKAKANAGGAERDTATGGTQAYTAGWTAAYGKVILPANSTSSASIVVKTPPSTVDGNATETTYTVSIDNNYAYIKNGNNVKAQVSHTLYNDGWTGCYNGIAISPSATQTLNPGGNVTVYAQAYASSGATSRTNVKSVQIKARALNLQEKTATANGNVTPGSGYDGLSKVTVNVPLFVKGSWGTGTSSNTYTVKYDASGSSPSASVTVTADISYDSTTHKYTAKANAGGSTRATKPSGTEAYDAGVSSVNVTNVGIYDGKSNLVSSNLSITSPISLWGGAKKNASGSYIWGSQVNITPVANVSAIGLYDANSNPITSQTIYSAIDIWPGVSINGGEKTWGSKVTISPPSFTFENPEIWTDAPGYTTKVTTTQYIYGSKKYMAWVKINDSNYNGTEVTFANPYSKSTTLYFKSSTAQSSGYYLWTFTAEDRTSGPSGWSVGNSKTIHYA